MCILAHGQDALLRPPASVTAQAAQRVRALAFFALISDGELDGLTCEEGATVMRRC